MTEPLVIAKKTTDHSFDLALLPKLANRHGLIAGATGTGKTVSLKVLAENFSNIGVPVFLTDVKGDLSGIAKAGSSSPKFEERLQLLGLNGAAFKAFPTVFWDLYGEQGHPVRTTVSEMGPILLARILNLNETQEGVLSAVFRIADDQGLLLLDFKDLRSMIQFVSDNAASFKSEYGNLSPASLGAIQRNLLALADQGGDKFFGEPALDLMDFLQTDSNGLGQINILSADKLMSNPKLYATFLLWMLSELFEKLPEVGDPEKPKLVFFFDEAHLLFDNAPEALQDKIEQVVRLIRSKGVGVYFVSQNPLDISEKVLGQLGNRVQHALRAFTPKDQKAVRAAADTFRANPELNISDVIMELGVGEALISFLDDKGTPNIVQRAFVMPPQSQFAPLTADERKAIIQQSVVAGVYEKEVDRESAYEKLTQKVQDIEQQKQQAAADAVAAKEAEKQQKAEEKEQARLAREQQREEERKAQQRAKMTQDIVGTFAKSAARAVGGRTGQTLMRGILGSLFGGK